MYEKRFGFHRKPFQSILTADDFFESESYQEIKPTILHAVRSDLGVAILTGPAGTGKTVTLEHFRRMLTSENQVIIFRGGTVRSAADLLYLLHRRLVNATPDPAKEASGSQRNTIQRWEVVNRLQRVSDFWGPVILLLDDAHLVGTDVFSELRDLLEEDADGRRLVRLMIAGPHVLEEVLAEPAMSDFAQRIRTHVFLEPMRSTEAVQYLSQQIKSCGGDPAAVFEQKAIERIVAAADGIPRCLNLLADESLMICENEQQVRVTVEIVNKALARLRHLPYSWNVSLYESDEDSEGEDLAGNDEEFAAQGEIEIDGGSATASRNDVTYASEGVIEIGGSAPARSTIISEAASSETTSRVTTGFVASHTTESRTPSYNSVEIGTETQPIAGIDAGDDGIFEFGADKTVSNAQVSSLSADEDADVLPELNYDNQIEEFFIDDDVLLNDENAIEDAADARPLAGEIPSKSDSVSFDEKFEAITFAFGTLEFEQVCVASGNSANESTADEDVEVLAGLMEACENLSATSNVECEDDLVNESLLHHLILPAGDQDDNDGDSTPSVTSGLHSDNVPLREEVHTADDDVETGYFSLNGDEPSEQDRVGSLSNYSPWTPPGKWQPVTERARVQSITEKNETLERPNAKSVKADRVHVFDRYTWCELGRSVTSEAPRRTAVYEGDETAVEWPPSLDGIAPAIMYPISEMDDDYVELLTDLGILPDEYAAAAAAAAARRQVVDNDDSVWSAYESAAEASEQDGGQLANDDHVTPDKSIEKIQTMLVDEEIETASWFSIKNESVEVVVQQPSSESIGQSDSSSGVDSESSGSVAVQRESVSAAAAAAAADEDDHATLNKVEDVIDTVSSGKRQLFTLPIDIDEVNAFRAPSTDSMGAEGAGTSSHGPTGHSSTTSPEQNTTPSGNSNSGPDGGSYLVLAEQEVDEQLEQDQYSPQLLKNARARVIAVATELGQLKRAAGAESVSAEQYSEQRTFEQRTAHLSVANEDPSADDDIAANEKPRSGFSNLFTRLRNMRNR